ncbi:NAD(P)(+) transhydrogenase (Re/Si-specific) subunit alpha, partial [Citreicella sp. C3M06]|nr:NAD(P)(+) transhydrogenase (Re/Si-specific) subunit alpha [Citreicella sp. C3M06]MBU2962920.1 NAD(P)(+) transhydrogenase (Re/Si-specific) subunit alpha [Citreicella sp. C3M06]
MKIGTPKELVPGENRVALTPESARALHKLGHECLVESGAGVAAGFSDAAYSDAGVTVLDSAEALYEQADVIAKVQPPSDAEVDRLTEG